MTVPILGGHLDVPAETLLINCKDILFLISKPTLFLLLTINPEVLLHVLLVRIELSKVR